MRYFENPKDERRSRYDRKQSYRNKKKLKSFAKVPHVSPFDEVDEEIIDAEEEVLDEVDENEYDEREDNEVIEQLEPDEE